MAKKSSAEILNFTTKDGLKMFDALSRTSTARQIKPLDQFNYIDYDHRYLYDSYNLMIGDVYIMVPPEFMHVSSESYSQSINILRQENSQKQKTGYHKRTITMDLVFNGMDEINGYKVPGPVHYHNDEKGNPTIKSEDYYVDGLRPLLAEFKRTPFLPIANDLLNNAYKIYAVALQSIVIRTIEGFQNALAATLVMQEVDLMPYIEMPNIMYQHTIDWDLFRFYTQSMLTEFHEYKKLQALPENKDHSAFRISILNETVLQTVVENEDGSTTAETVNDKLSGKTKEQTILERVLDPNSYETILDSRQSDVHIIQFQGEYSNMLTSIQMSDASSPTLQYLGGLDTKFGITIETTDIEVVSALEQCQIVNDLIVRNNPKVRGSIGFVKLESDLITFFGSLYCTIESVETATVPGIPGLYQVRLLCVSYDIAQSTREELVGFMPFDGHECTLAELALVDEGHFLTDSYNAFLQYFSDLKSYWFAKDMVDTTAKAKEAQTILDIAGDIFKTAWDATRYSISMSLPIGGYVPKQPRKDYEESVKKLAEDIAKYENGETTDPLYNAIKDNLNQSIEQTYEGLMKKIYQDNYAEWKLRTTMEVYPDLTLPTYSEVNKAISAIRNFRDKYELTQLEYEEYPIQPTNIMFGSSDAKRSTYPSSWVDNGIGNDIYKNGNVPKSSDRTYNVYVDPDFYVFYPNTYLSLYEDDLAANKESEQSNGTSFEDIYNSPIQNESTSVKVSDTITPSLDGIDTEDSKVNQFISHARRYIGHSYCPLSEGEHYDYKGKTFDEIGLITCLLKEFGLLPSNYSRLNPNKLDSLDILERVDVTNIRRGDIVLNSVKNNCALYIGTDESGTPTIIYASEVNGVCEQALMFVPSYVYRIKALYTFDYSGTSTSNSTKNNSGTYYNEQTNTKRSSLIDTTTGYNRSESTNTVLETPLNEDLGIWSPITAEELNSYVKSISPNSPFVGHCQMFIEAAEQTGYNPRYILAHTVHETGWGLRSEIARTKNNWFGIGAFDSNPLYYAQVFNGTMADGIILGAKWIREHYYDSNFAQKTISQMRYNNGTHQYATSDHWAQSIANIMSAIPNKNKSAQYLEPYENSLKSQTRNVNSDVQNNLNNELSKNNSATNTTQSDISNLGIKNSNDNETELIYSKYKQSTFTRNAILTSDEFDSLSNSVASKCEGQTEECKFAFAQTLYNIIQYIYSGVGITSVLELSKYNVTDYNFDDNDKEQAKRAVYAVFVNGYRWKENCIILDYTSFENSNSDYMNKESKYKLLGSVGQFNFYGYTNKTSKTETKYICNNISGVGESSSTSVKIYNDIDINAVNYSDDFETTHTTTTHTSSSGVTHGGGGRRDEDFYSGSIAFGKPIYIKPSYFDTHNSSVGTEWQKLHTVKNRLNTAFVDSCQYSGKGRLVKAFPAFLFCILDDQCQWYDGKKLWTNYYVYKPVVDIKYHAANDMPTSTAQILVTNTYHNLDRSSAALVNYRISDDKSYSKMQRMLWKNFGMIAGGARITNRMIQLHSVIFNHTKVREGCRCHLRMGYGSDPMSLAPIINGEISGMSLGDQIEITITSDGHELIQNVTSDKSKDINNGALGLFGLGATQEPSNLIANIMCKRESWINHLFFAAKWFEASKYNIEHFGIYLNRSDRSMYGGFTGGINAGIEEQYDLLMNIYKGTTEKGLFNDYRHTLYLHYSTAIGETDSEKNITFNKYNMTPWDTFQLCAQTNPEFLIKPEMYQFDSRLFYGLPFDLTKYRYDVLSNAIYQECKSNTQVHYIDSVTSIIENQVSVTSKHSFTNAKVMYGIGKSVKATPLIHSDDTIDHSKQSTHIIDSPIVQNYAGPDKFYEAVQIEHGKNCARRIGISNLLYGWQQQYQGQILCLGQPQIRPDDYLMIDDFYTNLNGLAMTREVIHSFSSVTGFTTSIIPGVIGISPEQNTETLIMLCNLLKLYSMFSEYTLNRRTKKECYERYADYIKEVDKFEKAYNNRGFWYNQEKWNLANSITKNTNTLIRVGSTAYIMYHLIRTVQNVGSIIDTIKIIANTYKVLKSVTKATWLFKNIKTTYNVVRSIQIVSRVAKTAKSLAQTTHFVAEASAMAAGAVTVPTSAAVTGAATGATAGAAGGPVAPLTIAIGIIIGLAIGAIIDAIAVWVENRNTCILLPLWWEGEPFISGVKGGEKILLVPSTATATNENTGADGVETDKDDKTSVGDN